MSKTQAPDYDQLLSLQEKLALAMTSAKSVRDLAAFMGISHQKLGRWLREGEEKGIKKIPDDAKQLINDAFQAHVQIAKFGADMHALPFDAEVPIFAWRAPLRSGKLGDRVVIDHTQFIRKDLRDDIIIGLHQSRDYLTLSVRSMVELAVYLQTADEREGKVRRSREAEDYHQLAKALLLHDFNEGEDFKPMYTKKVPLAFYDAHEAVSEINQLLRERHEPASSFPGTAYADQYLLQVKPHGYENRIARKGSPKTATADRKSRRINKGRGPK